MRLIDSWDIEQNFWEHNPQLKIAFKDVYSKDKTKSKSTSSQLMWAVALYTDTKSKFKDLPELPREALIKADFNKEFSVKEYKELIERWKSFMSPAERQLLQLERLLDERTAYLEGLKFTKETADELEKRVGATGKLFDELVRLKAAIAEEESEGTVKGGAVESLSEKGEI
jgi:hypothetical protein